MGRWGDGELTGPHERKREPVDVLIGFKVE
jgi:hypothetical protein